jgi:hypothetical protein
MAPPEIFYRHFSLTDTAVSLSTELDKRQLAIRSDYQLRGYVITHFAGLLPEANWGEGKGLS